MKCRDGFVSTDGYPGLDCSGDPGLTDQSQAKDCDVNLIVDHFAKTGILPGTDVKSVFGDFSDPMDFHDAQNLVAHANEQFASLDAKVRKRFHNDPVEFLSFMQDPGNAQEAVKLGLATLRPSEKPISSPEPSKGGKKASSEPAPAPSAKNSKDDT